MQARQREAVSEMKKVRVLYHDNCFDGVSSAAVFSRFYRGHIDPDAEIEYEGLTHKAGQHIGEEQFGEGENAIVDFKYCASDKLTWWFDHHQSAFLSPEDESHFRSGTWRAKFYNPSYKSCTKLIADTAAARYGFDGARLGELVHWAHVIDGALYESAAQCVELKEPALQLMQVIEGTPDESFIEQI